MQARTHDEWLSAEDYKEFKLDRERGTPVYALVNPADENEISFNFYRSMETSRNTLLLFLGLAAFLALYSVGYTVRKLVKG